MCSWWRRGWRRCSLFATHADCENPWSLGAEPPWRRVRVELPSEHWNARISRNYLLHGDVTMKVRIPSGGAKETVGGTYFDRFNLK